MNAVMAPGEWAAIAARIDMAWPGSDFSDEAAGSWYYELAHFTAADVNAAVSVLIRSNRRPFLPGLGQLLAIIEGTDEADLPTVAEVVRLCDAANDIRVSGHDWREALRLAGGPVVVDFADEYGLAAIVTAVPQFGTRSRRDLDFAWREFSRHWLARERKRLALGALALSAPQRSSLPAGEL